MSAATVATAVRVRPILFSAPMVRAILDGRKTQTRRAVKAPRWYVPPASEHFVAGSILHEVPCPYGVPGDRLWVRETWRADYYVTSETIYRADGPAEAADLVPWRPSIFMPRDRSRLTLEIADVRVQRLQEIDHADILSEAVLDKAITGGELATLRRLFGEGWDSINGKRATWASNPWVWCLTFRRVA